MKNLLGLFMAMTFFSFLANAQEKKANSEKLLRHVVLFKFTDSSSEWDVKKVEEAFRALPKRIKEVHSFEWGKNNSPENLNQGFTHCFFVTFKSEADREVYLPHPSHLAFVEVLKPHLDKVLVIDYWADK
ncbi:Dabb family protein [Flavihumibacter sp.]|uniref:Dabb family protein n=1 Tax=Flavihumibacter sp. TaxID=1913981 RepID=UPI002FC9A86E